MSDIPDGPVPTFPAHITFDPAGIEMFATILHLVYAVRNAPGNGGAKDKHVREYMAAHCPQTVRWNVTRSDNLRHLYGFRVIHSRTERHLEIMVNTDDPPETCLCARSPHTPGWVRLLLDSVRLKS